MLDDPLLAPSELVDLKIATSERTLEKWRHQGTGPRYLRLGRRVMYRGSDVERWLEERLVEPAATR